MTGGEPETAVSASLQKIKSIKNPNIFLNFYFIKSETSDSFVSNFDGHFAYLKTMDFKYWQHERPSVESHISRICFLAKHVFNSAFLCQQWPCTKDNSGRVILTF